MKVLFFPHDQKFWLDHGLFMLFLAATQMVIIVPLQDIARFIFFCDMFWFPLFTIAVLLFRNLYKTLNWKDLSSRQFVEYSIVYSLSSGLTIAVMMSAIFSSFFYQELTSDIIPHSTNKLSLAKLVMGSIAGNWIQTTVFISAWIFLYNSITSTKRIRETELLYARSQHNLKEATLNSLSNQLNPHFLFNALNNIRFMVHENQQHADAMIVSLSDILRYSLESSSKEKVLVGEEVAIIENYIDIIKSQLEERLSFEILISLEHYRFLIPPMSLQLLVENSIKHGIENIQEGGKLKVESAADDIYIYFTVINDLPNHNPIKQPTTGIGLKNIARRLELLYGSDSDFTISKTATEFTVMLKIPKEIPQ